MTRGLFVTGTDTGVGKTMVTALLALAFAESGLRVGVMKPAETGCLTDGSLIPEDAVFLRDSSGCDAPLDVINPYRMTEPLTPALAAERNGIAIDLTHIGRCYADLAASHDIVLMEGAGGLLAPLTAETTMLDLAATLHLPVLVVAGNVLGVISHAALTVAVATHRGVPVIGVIVNHSSSATDLATQTNVQSLRRWGGATVLTTVPYIDAPDLQGLRALVHTVPVPEILDAIDRAAAGRPVPSSR